MKAHLPNSAFLGNIDPFLREFDPSSPDTLEVTANDKWISVHPVVISMIAALGLTIIRQREIIPALKAQEKVVLDFERAGAATQSFIHALISDVLRK